MNPSGESAASAPDSVAARLDPRRVPPGEYDLACLPIELRGADGAPARVVLRSLE